MKNFVISPIFKFIDSIIGKFGYKNIFLGLTIVIILLATLDYIANFVAGYVAIVNLATRVIFSIAFYYLVKANIKSYFYFLIYFIIHSFISLKMVLPMLEGLSLVILIVLIIINLLFFLHGIYHWGKNNKKGVINPLPLTHKNYLWILIGVYFVLTIICYFTAIHNVANSLVIFAMFNLITAIYLINTRKIQGFIPLFLYFISMILTSFKSFYLIEASLYAVMIIFAYKYWYSLYFKAKPSEKSKI